MKRTMPKQIELDTERQLLQPEEYFILGYLKEQNRVTAQKWQSENDMEDLVEFLDYQFETIE